MNAKLHLVLAVGLLVAGCTSGARPHSQEEDPWESRWVVPEEYLGSRMATFNCKEDPAQTLDLWLDLLGPQVVRERGDETARLRDPSSPDDPRRDFVIRWRRREDELDVQVTSLDTYGGDFCRRTLASFALVMEAKQGDVEFAQSSGCAPPSERPPGSLNWREAIDAEFALIGLVMLEEDVDQGANSSWYGPPGGKPEWRLDWEGLDSNFPTLELFHDATPFDAKGERDLLAKILERAGVTPWGLTK